MHSFFALLERFRSDERGVFAIIFGLLAIVLVALAGSAVDYTSMETARTRAQIALDSAALGLAPKIYDDDVTEAQMIADAQAIVSERVAGARVDVEITGATIDEEGGTLRLDGRVTVPMAFVQLVGIETLTAAIASEATKGSINLEVALAIDITKSMEGTDQIGALDTATQQLIDAVVREDQTPTYSKMAIVPWSMGVNVGAYADDVRGEPLPPKPMTGAVWAGTTSGTITGITRASPGVVTDSAHGLSTGDVIGIHGVLGMTQINNKAYRVVKINNNSFSLQQFTSGNTVNTTSGNGYSSYTSGGTWRKCALTTCEVTVTSTAHGYVNNDWIVTTDVGGLTGLNNKAWQVKDKAANTFKLKDSIGPEYGATYTANTGNIWCTLNPVASRPCEFYRYQAADTTTYRTDRLSDCVTERQVGDVDLYKDTAVSTKWLGRHYPDGNSLNTCITNQIVPLTSLKETLHETTGLMAAGSTAGHTGLAWAWYLLSHSFTTDLFGAGSTSVAADPDAEDAEPVMKVVVLMTDGLFNTSYCNGVVAKNADSIAGNSQQRINCNGTNSTTQGTTLCNAIEDDDIIIYTVAFALHEIADEDDREVVRQMLADCATEDGGAYEVTDGDALLEAFRKIGQNITDLRLSM